MKNRLFLLLVPILATLTGCAALEDSHVMPEREVWQMHPAGNPPSNRAERVAVEVARNGRQPVKNSGIKGYFENEERGCAVIAVEEAVLDQKNVVKMTRYLVRDNRIQGESYPSYITPVDKTREGFAREVAHQARDGRQPDIPLLYESKYSYSPRYDGFCSVTVQEYDIQRNPVATYTFDVCEN
ncbi:hypothetical protein [Geobacter sp. DSM 9736]|uniref:hypothetical protein n=1 Tax=Geobacter sp. DSM 9736 TaxID=1277350 RepID=UPI000B50A1FA|nr:hypothetical protein [Geobacter sp. DSM 9736]SNB46067.1 hypothetical protein SAMN06269301_1507 [Geobacter sp. DSM 9736]